MVPSPFSISLFGVFLTYFLAEAQEPAFLQKLRGQYGDTSGRLERPQERARKPKNKDDDDDEPVYVDEESNEVISKEDYKALVEGDPSNENEEGTSTTGKNESKTQSSVEAGNKTQSNLTEIGGQKKRKQVKVVGEESKTEAEAPAEESVPKTSAPRKPKKAKKIKLSFDEE